MGIINKLFCKHDWVKIHEKDANWHGEMRYGVWTTFILKCKKCGEIKKIYI